MDWVAWTLRPKLHHHRPVAARTWESKLSPNVKHQYWVSNSLYILPLATVYRLPSTLLFLMQNNPTTQLLRPCPATQWCSMGSPRWRSAEPLSLTPTFFNCVLLKWKIRLSGLMSTCSDVRSCKHLQLSICSFRYAGLFIAPSILSGKSVGLLRLEHSSRSRLSTNRSLVYNGSNTIAMI